jgi:hypothetical protein
MLKSPKYKEEKIQEALEILYRDRKNEFQELAQAFLGKDKLGEIPNWREFVLNFCLDVSDSFKTWTGQKPPSTTSPQKALTILRQIGNGMTSMNQLTKLLDVSYNLSIEFNEIYKRIK